MQAMFDRLTRAFGSVYQPVGGAPRIALRLADGPLRVFGEGEPEGVRPAVAARSRDVHGNVRERRQRVPEHDGGVDRLLSDREEADLERIGLLMGGHAA